MSSCFSTETLSLVCPPLVSNRRRRRTDALCPVGVQQVFLASHVFTHIQDICLKSSRPSAKLLAPFPSAVTDRQRRPPAAGHTAAVAPHGYFRSWAIPPRPPRLTVSSVSLSVCYLSTDQPANITATHSQALTSNTQEKKINRSERESYCFLFPLRSEICSLEAAEGGGGC